MQTTNNESRKVPILYNHQRNVIRKTTIEAYGKHPYRVSPQILFIKRLCSLLESLSSSYENHQHTESRNRLLWLTFSCVLMASETF